MNDTTQAASVFSNEILLSFKQHLNTTRTGHVQLQLCTFAQFPATQHIDVVAGEQQTYIHPHVLLPVGFLRYPVLKGVDRLVALDGEIACSMVKGCPALVEVVVGYRR